MKSKSIGLELAGIRHGNTTVGTSMLLGVLGAVIYTSVVPGTLIQALPAAVLVVAAAVCFLPADFASRNDFGRQAFASDRELSSQLFRLYVGAALLAAVFLFQTYTSFYGPDPASFKSWSGFVSLLFYAFTVVSFVAAWWVTFLRTTIKSTVFIVIRVAVGTFFFLAVFTSGHKDPEKLYDAVLKSFLILTWVQFFLLGFLLRVQDEVVKDESKDN